MTEQQIRAAKLGYLPPEALELKVVSLSELSAKRGQDQATSPVIRISGLFDNLRIEPLDT